MVRWFYCIAIVLKWRWLLTASRNRKPSIEFFLWMDVLLCWLWRMLDWFFSGFSFYLIFAFSGFLLFATVNWSLMTLVGFICNFSLPEDKMLLHHNFLIFISSQQIPAQTIILMYSVLFKFTVIRLHFLYSHSFSLPWRETTPLPLAMSDGISYPIHWQLTISFFTICSFMTSFSSFQPHQVVRQIA